MAKQRFSKLTALQQLDEWAARFAEMIEEGFSFDERGKGAERQL